MTHTNPGHVWDRALRDATETRDCETDGVAGLQLYRGVGSPHAGTQDTLGSRVSPVPKTSRFSPVFPVCPPDVFTQEGTVVLPLEDGSVRECPRFVPGAPEDTPTRRTSVENN